MLRLTLVALLLSVATLTAAPIPRDAQPAPKQNPTSPTKISPKLLLLDFEWPQIPPLGGCPIPMPELPPPPIKTNCAASDRLTAYMLLATPPGTPDVKQDVVKNWPNIKELQEAIQAVAVENEWMDPREARYIMSNKDEFESDMAVLRKRYQELKDAPKVGDHERFGVDRKQVNELIRFNRAYLKHLEERLVWEQDRADIITTVIGETNQLYRAWDALRDAKCDFYYVTVRRHALIKLQNMVGKEAYITGVMPDYVPVWRFQQR